MDVYYVKEHEEGYDIRNGVENRVNEYSVLIGGSTGIFEKTSGIYARKQDAIAHAKQRIKLLFGDGSACPFQTLEEHYQLLESQGMTTVQIEIDDASFSRCRFYTLIVCKQKITEGPPE